MRIAPRSRLTVRQLRQSGLIGLWKDRNDIRDSSAYARRLREQAQKRGDISYDNEYRYYKRFDELLPENNHLVVIIVFKTRLDEHGKYVPNNFVVTGWAKYIRPKG